MNINGNNIKQLEEIIDGLCNDLITKDILLEKRESKIRELIFSKEYTFGNRILHPLKFLSNSKNQLISSYLFKKYELNKRKILNECRNDQKHKVSIIMPTWNRKSTIMRAINSVLNQSYTHFELIIIDDGSTDDTEKFLNPLIKKNNKITFIKSEHKGVSYARNIGLNHANGKYIAYLDTDNIWDTHFLKLSVNALETHTRFSCVYSGLQIIDNIQNSKFYRLEAFNRKKLLKFNYIDLNIFMHDIDLFKLNGGFDEKLSRLVDWDLIIRYTEKNPPFVLKCILAEYYIDFYFDRISFYENFKINRESIIKKSITKQIMYEKSRNLQIKIVKFTRIKH